MLRTSQPSVQRRGMILIVVLSLLTLFAIVGISFVLVSDSLALSSRIAKEAETTFRPDVSPESAFAQFLGQLVYDVEDDASGVYSGLRGHSFARTMYGYNRDNPVSNDKPFSGLGRLRIPINQAGLPNWPAPNPTNPDAERYLGYLVNHTYFPNDGFLIDPERVTVRTGANALAAPRGGYVNGAASYTFPDHNSFFLAALDPNYNGTRIFAPSFHRPWLFGALNDQTNPNWTNVQGKYLTPRPRPAEHPGFPFPEDAGGDVKNLIGAPGGNDSIWIDIGAPVMTSADGRKYKMLFAPLILDMDGRINVNVHGNLRLQGNSHVSAQGWGPWEVNPERVLAPGELNRLIAGDPTTGAPRTAGRYGMDRNPGLTGSVYPPGTSPRAWGQVDFDALDNDNNTASNRFALPTDAGQVPYHVFPSFPPTSFKNASIAERTNHPWRFNPIRPTDDDRHIPASAMAALLRRGDTGGQGLTSELTRLLPNTVADARRRHLITTHSADLDRPGATPYIWDRTAQPMKYAWDPSPSSASSLRPTSLPGLRSNDWGEWSTGLPPFRDIVNHRGGTPAPNSEFDPISWTSQLASVMRVNLNRPLAMYPDPDPATGLIADIAAYNLATQDRILLAQDLFDRLWRVTGAMDPATVDPTTMQDDFRTLRWLAQLAVNMVDYIDQDDYMTVFPWFPNNAAQVVVGTEMPGALINETYVQLENRPDDPGLQDRANAVAPRPRAEAGYRMTFWAELYNPRVDTPGVDGNPGTSGVTRLLRPNGDPVYRLTLAWYQNVNDNRAVLDDPDNVFGEPSFGTINAVEQSTVEDWPNTAVGREILPGGLRYDSPINGNNGFYSVGPANDFLVEPGYDVDPAIPTTHRTARMSLPVPIPAGGASPYRTTTMLLRRLACPALPAGPGNPWVTVDTHVPSFSDNLGNDTNFANVFVNGNTPPNLNPTFTPRADRRSFGRFQPFQGNYFADGTTRRQNPDPVLVNQAQHTFFRHNHRSNVAPAFAAPDAQSTLKTDGFDWLVHLDRQLVSPMELLHVSAWKPHQLTSKFIQRLFSTVGNPAVAHQHVAKWFDEDLQNNRNTRLYRFLEFVETAPRSAGLNVGGRIPGKVNLNTINDLDVFLALCDRQPGNRYTDAQLTTLWNNIRNRRHAALTQGWPATNSGSTKGIFMSLATGPVPGSDQWTGHNDTLGFPGGSGIDNTILGPVIPPAQNRGRDVTGWNMYFGPHPYFDAGGNRVHPYDRFELLNKIYNNVTVRSNVFAVWVTVGYFEVRDENRRPVTLGAEIGRSEGRHIRHRMFALVDRTRMELFSGKLNSSGVTPPNNQPTPFNVGALSGNNLAGKPFALQPGHFVTLDPEGTVTSPLTGVVNGSGVQIEVRQPVQANPQVPYVIYGNPGPWTRYDPKKDPCILHFSVID